MSVRPDNDVSDLLGIVKLFLRADDVFRTADVNASTGEVEVLCTEGVYHLRERQVVTDEFVRIDLNPNLPFTDPAQFDFGHIFYIEDVVSHIFGDLFHLPFRHITVEDDADHGHEIG